MFQRGTPLRILRAESGQALILVAVVFLLLLAVAGLILDCGRVVAYRNQFRVFCEAAAHAGVQEADVYWYVGSDPPAWVVKVRQDDADREARACLDENLAGFNLSANGLRVLAVVVTFPADDCVRVELQAEGRTFLARTLGGGYASMKLVARGEAYATVGP